MSGSIHIDTYSTPASGGTVDIAQQAQCIHLLVEAIRERYSFYGVNNPPFALPQPNPDRALKYSNLTKTHKALLALIPYFYDANGVVLTLNKACEMAGIKALLYPQPDFRDNSTWLSCATDIVRQLKYVKTSLCGTLQCFPDLNNPNKKGQVLIFLTGRPSFWRKEWPDRNEYIGGTPYTESEVNDALSSSGTMTIEPSQDCSEVFGAGSTNLGPGTTVDMLSDAGHYYTKDMTSESSEWVFHYWPKGYTIHYTTGSVFTDLGSEGATATVTAPVDSEWINAGLPCVVTNPVEQTTGAYASTTSLSAESHAWETISPASLGSSNQHGPYVISKVKESASGSATIAFIKKSQYAHYNIAALFEIQFTVATGSLGTDSSIGYQNDWIFHTGYGDFTYSNGNVSWTDYATSEVTLNLDSSVERLTSSRTTLSGSGTLEAHAAFIQSGSNSVTSIPFQYP